MRTTIRINDDLLQRAKKRATDEGRTLTSLIEDALALVVAKHKASRRGRVELPVSKASGGVLPGIDLNRSSDLEEAMNEP
jgi:predicted transcriptional regulator